MHPIQTTPIKYIQYFRVQASIDLHLPPARGPIERSIYCSLLPGPEVALVTPVKTTLEPSSSVLTVAVKES